MRFSVEIRDTEMVQLLQSLMSITGPEAWTRRFEWIERELNENSLMEDWLRERCAIELAMREILSSSPLIPKQPLVLRTRAQYELVAFAAGVIRCYERLSEGGRRRLRGVLLDGLKEDKGLLSIQHEITTAVHLMSRGFDVEFQDIEHGGGVDFIARKDDVEIEIECKMFSADLGRKIHRRRSATLYKELADVLAKTYNSATKGLIVAVTIPDRLTPAPKQHREIKNTVRTGLLRGEATTQTEHCTVRTWDFSIKDSPFNKPPEKLDRDEIDLFVETRTARSNANLMILFSWGQRAVILSVSSEKTDEVLDGMRRQLREAVKGQFSRRRPAMLAVQLHALTANELVNLAQSDSTSRTMATGLQIMTSDLMQRPSSAHIHTIVYRSHITVNKSAVDGTTNGNGPSYLIKNPTHALYGDLRYGIFDISTS
ncbi:hypothetical protein G9Q38_13115 [Pusillimonas sp. DMV24BSW_D]|uniref:hypothetical protein n=1 Tax=Neopusillimonas aestuarii TaxID=2716226 RepID=UPI00140E31C4|nr:hypothetical protein [Pusillimonas sp. DMV24BSW_D]QIM50044.1 hypothetical protein G9Q38_13115 [Pusillimonas sp. DMV24BSW_D]